MEKKGTSGGQYPIEIINSAIEYGLGVLVKNHPSFGEEYIQKHINKDRLNQQIHSISEELNKEKNLSDEEKIKYLHKELADYVAAGGAFDDIAKRVVLKGSLEEKARSWNPLKRFPARKELDGEKKFNNTLEAFKDLYSLLKTGDYAKNMPELAQAVQTVYNAGFFDPAVKTLEAYGLIDEKKYALIKKSQREKVEKASEGVLDFFYKQAAAIIVGILGMLMVFTSVNMTGGVVGSLGSNNIKLLGGFLFLIAIVLFFNITHKKKKLKTFKNR